MYTCVHYVTLIFFFFALICLIVCSVSTDVFQITLVSGILLYHGKFRSQNNGQCVNYFADGEF